MQVFEPMSMETKARVHNHVRRLFESMLTRLGQGLRTACPTFELEKGKASLVEEALLIAFQVRILCGVYRLPCVNFVGSQ